MYAGMICVCDGVGFSQFKQKAPMSVECFPIGIPQIKLRSKERMSRGNFDPVSLCHGVHFPDKPPLSGYFSR
jgi:hypothetical protein